MTLYFRRHKIQKPLKPRSKGYLETILATEAAEREREERATKKEKQHRVRIFLQMHSFLQQI
jgi:hypothetical protein